MRVTQAGALVTVLLQRVRDPMGAAHSRAFALEILSDAQRFVNLAQSHVLVEETLTTEARRILYPVTASLPLSARVEYIRDSVRDLTRSTLSSLAHVNSRWPSRIGLTFESWVPIGRDLIVIYPAKAAASSVTVVSTKLTTAFAGEGDEVELPPEAELAMLDLAEAILLLRSRMWGPFTDAAKRLVAHKLALDEVAK